MIKKNTNYDFVFYLPIEFPIEDDGIRSTDPEFQRKIDERYKNVLNEWDIKHEVISGSIEDRLQKILEKIK